MHTKHSLGRFPISGSFMKLIGYSVTGDDNDSIAFPAEGGVARCIGCLHVIDKWALIPRQFELKRRDFDLSSTYDGVDIASSQFRKVVTDRGIRGFVFRPLIGVKGYYQVLATKVVKFDPEGRGTVFEDRCPICGKYDSVAGATPAELKRGQRIDANEVVRTDLEFGSGDEQSPVLICGLEASQILRDSKLKGLHFQKAYLNNT